MSYKQEREFRQISSPEYGMCLANVRRSFGIAPKAATAKAAWDIAKKRHADKRFPSGVCVPVFWAHNGGAGHCAVSLGDGRILSNVKGDVWAYINVDYCKNYLRWTEDINGVDVVSEERGERREGDNEQIAREVIDGKWGNGQERKNRLAAAGYDYAAVQAIVNRLVKK